MPEADLGWQVPMTKSSKRPNTSADARLPTVRSRVHRVAELIAKTGKDFSRKDTFLFTVVVVVALISHSFGHGGPLAIGFACFFMILVPIMRYFRWIDT